MTGKELGQMPVHGRPHESNDDDPGIWFYPGLTLRQHIATKCLAALLQRGDFHPVSNAVEYADLLPNELAEDTE